jgi:hypothetical protein
LLSFNVFPHGDRVIASSTFGSRLVVEHWRRVVSHRLAWFGGLGGGLRPRPISFLLLEYLTLLGVFSALAPGILSWSRVLSLLRIVY